MRPSSRGFHRALRFFNGKFAVAALGSMMALAGETAAYAALRGHADGPVVARR